MNYVQTRQRNIVGILTKEQLKKAIAESINFLKVGVKLHVTLNSTNFADTYEKEDAELEAIDKVLEVPPIEMLANMEECCSSATSAIHLRCQGFTLGIDRVTSLCKYYSAAYVPLQQTEREQLASEVKEMLAHGANFLFYQFNIDTFLETMKEKDPIVNIELASYCSDKRLKFGEVVKFVRDIRNKYRATMEVFAEYPEYEDDFISMVGPNYEDFVKYIKLLTIDIVKKIINGTLSVEDVLTEFAMKCAEDVSLLSDTE